MKKVALKKQSRLRKKTISLVPELVLYYGYDILQGFYKVLAEYSCDKVFLITDETVYDIHGKKFHEMLIEKGVPVSLHVIKATEDDKSMSTLEAICNDLISNAISKDSIIISFGGGVVGNISGLAAALIYRGVRYIEVPTTFMGQTDSTLSNKQAVNGGSGKNQLGVYYEPLFIWSDLKYITTEKWRHVKAAIVEGIKNALIQDIDLLPYFIEKDFAHRQQSKEQLLELFDTITDSKNKILRLDPTEKKYAVILEYGHTFGHAIEYLTHGRVIHGEAVAAGMCIAAEVSYCMDGLTEEKVQLHYDLLGDYISQDLLDQNILNLISPEKIMDKIQSDNKRTQKGIKYILLEKIGICMNPNGDYQAAVDEITVRECIVKFFDRFQELQSRKKTNIFWAQWDKYIHIFQKKKAGRLEEIIDEFFGQKPRVPQLLKLGIHHVAIYMGDYSRESQIHVFAGCLQSFLSNEIKSMEYGPSYIAPKEYGTPGWWFTIRLNNDEELELFTCESFGQWREKDPDEKEKLMSHYALQVDSMEQLEQLIGELKRYDDIRMIMYTEHNDLGHTYAHFKNLTNHRVLELIYCQG